MVQLIVKLIQNIITFSFTLFYSLWGYFAINDPFLAIKLIKVLFYRNSFTQGIMGGYDGARTTFYGFPLAKQREDKVMPLPAYSDFIVTAKTQSQSQLNFGLWILNRIGNRVTYTSKPTPARKNWMINIIQVALEALTHCLQRGINWKMQKGQQRVPKWLVGSEIV